MHRPILKQPSSKIILEQKILLPHSISLKKHVKFTTNTIIYYEKYSEHKKYTSL